MKEYYSKNSFEIEFSENVEDLIKANKIEIVNVLGVEMIHILSNDIKKCKKKRSARQ